MLFTMKWLRAELRNGARAVARTSAAICGAAVGPFNQRPACRFAHAGYRVLPPVQAVEQLLRRPGVRRHAELDLHFADGGAALGAEHAVDAADVVAHAGEDLLQLAVLVDGEFRDVR